ncbi:hypothetical protein GCM10027036_35690 [Flavihumibacter cheonanensis]|jgi:hypothetical protein|uniref:phage holin family protein n=1 Tax=Flavihumibacter cheonanensis TaxID=1442385 RepID=UPI001EF840EF|nr:phage holin family protein [Flavihumibacter cheonanensis]MCG7753572.1 phage holin family protein [Flavihumibacter cheonanensis]
MSEAQEPGYFEKLENQFQDYINNRIWLVKLEATEKAARLTSLALIMLVVAGLAFFVLLFISLMAGYYFAELTGSLFYGFSIVTGIYILLLVLVLVFRKNYIGPFLINTLIRLFLEKKNDDDEREPGTP